VRRVYEAAARRDAEAVLALYGPNVEWDVSRSRMARLVGGGVYFGHEGLRQFFAKYHEAWEDIEYEATELIDAGEFVVSVDTERTRGRLSGAETDLTQYGVWTVEDGRVVRALWFSTRDEALKAAGLSE
jgi:ketosteroid isomerase-like protein